MTRYAILDKVKSLHRPSVVAHRSSPISVDRGTKNAVERSICVPFVSVHVNSSHGIVLLERKPEGQQVGELYEDELRWIESH